MTKPLIVIYLNCENLSKHPEEKYHQIKSLNRDIEKYLTKDYYSIILPVKDRQTEVQVFYEKDMIPVKFEKLKEILLEKINLKTNG